MRVADVFSAARWRACWATTFTFEPAFFEAFLLRRLGDPPFNVVVLGDLQRLAKTWEEIGPHDSWRVPGLNQKYLVRGVSLPGRAFHAKTILLGNDKRGVLLVGSGNLGLTGLERGHEVYTRLDSDADSSSFAAWREWMAGVVGHLDDPLVRSRWADLLRRLPWLTPPNGAASGPLVTNARVALMDQFLAGLQAPVDELHVTAPFFDHELVALTRLVAATKPRHLRIYLGDDASVDGDRLGALLKEVPAVTRVIGYAAASDGRPAYVHAKLVAAVTGSRARLLAGSANMSGPALLSVAWSGAGNVEAAILRDVDASEARALFAPDDRLAQVDLSADQVGAFQLADIASGPAYPIALVSATRGSDGLISITTKPVLMEGLFVTDGRTSVVVAGGRAREPLGSNEGVQLVWLVAANGDPLSNHVPVDDEISLDRVLTASQPAGDDRPRELDPLDDRHPLGQILLDLHRAALFDVEDTPAARRLEATMSSEASDPDGVWDLYFREELGRDPRAGRYSGLGQMRHADGLFLDEFGALLLQMLDRAPRPGELRLLDGTSVTREEAQRDGVRWPDARKVRVRAYNVLVRWANAVNDPRVRWFGELAPVRHYEGLLGALARIWPQARAERDEDRWLTADQLGRLLASLLGAFVRTDRSQGFLASRGEEERNEALTHLRAHGAPPIAAALAYDVLRVPRPATYFAWQPFLVPALDWGVIATDATTSGFPPRLARAVRNRRSGRQDPEPSSPLH